MKRRVLYNTKDISGVHCMEKIWEFFENLNEIVYVSDIDSHEMIYMKKRVWKCIILIR